MNWSLISRRLLLPVVAAMACVCAIIGVYAAARVTKLGAAEHEIPMLLWVTLVALVAGAGLGLAIVYLYSRAQAKQIAGSFSRVLVGSGVRSAAASGSIDQVTEALARSVAHVIAQGAKDQSQLLTIISSMTEALVALDHQQRILLANRAAEQLLGIKMPDATNQPIWEHVAVDGVTQAAAAVMLTGRPRSFTTGPHNGIYLDVMISRLPAAGGLVIVAHDVTEATRYQRLREEFVANVSHELRTPLAVIKGYVETLRDGALDDRERATQYLQTVAQHAEHLSNLVNDILDLSRLENRIDAPRAAAVDVGQLVARVTDSLQPAAKRKRQTLSLDVAPELPAVAGSADDLARAISNLVENAIKYSRESAVVRVSASAVDQRVGVTVEDNGIGISEEDLPRIFERFYRSDRSRSREMGGTGLGLSIVKHIVQAHGGTVEVTSRLGAGSKFTMSLPVARA